MRLLLKLIATIVLVPVILIVVLLAILIVWGGQPGSIYSQSYSPDGRYYLVARKDKFSTLIPTMPGNGSDASGTVTVYTKSGRELGTVSVSMMQEVYGIRWERDQLSLQSGKVIKLPE